MPEWIPRKIMPDIMEAIEVTDRSTYVFYITSEGGEGKTILLRQIGMDLGSPDGMASNFPWSGILDLYHADVNSSSGLETRLSRALETGGEFQRYRDERDAYAARREAGYVGPELEAERARMAEVFAECMNDVTRWSRVVIALDTTERMQYEVDEVQKLCGLEGEATTVRAWLLDQLRHWENCVVLLAGRPEADPYLGKALAEALTAVPRVHYETRTLGGFDEDEVCAYFELKKVEFPALEDLEPSFCQRLWEVTEGKPIRLDLSVEVIQHGLGFDQFREKVETGSAEEVCNEIDLLLIEHVMRGEPDSSLRNILRYLAVARKGLDAGLLQYLEKEWEPEECQSRLDTIAERGFVKRHPEDERLLLHDEMFQLCDTYLLQPEEVQRLSACIVEWYDKQIEPVEDEKRRQNIQVDSLLYRLRANPDEGYHWYARQAEFAIRAAEVGFDMRMRSEVMAFLKSLSPVDQRLLSDTPGLAEEFNRDSATHWIKRLMAWGENDQSVSIAETVLDASLAFFPSDEPEFELARADLVVYFAQALIYTGRVQPGVDLLRKVIANLEGEHRPEELAPQEAKTYTGWRRNLVLGRAHNNLGYAYWMHLGHYRAALREFRSALPYFRASELWEELANTNDNMGRVYARLRHQTRAETLVEESLSLRRELGRDYRIALSLNSRAIVHLEFGEPHRARRLSEDALSIFEVLEAQRGIGLALITLGRSLRDLGALWTQRLYPYQDCDRFLSDGAKHLDRAIGIFEQIVDEPVRLVEALNQRGCTYRERARLALQMAPDRPLARTISLGAIQDLERAIKLAKEYKLLVWYVDSCEDLAQIYFLRGDFDSTEVWLQSAEENVPEDYKIREGGLPVELPEEERIEAFLLQMGKIELLRGNLVFAVGTEGDVRLAPREVLRKAAQHYMLSAVYFERYSYRAVGLRATFKQMYDRFKLISLDDLEYLREEALPELANQYSIDLSRLGSFFEDTLGLAVEWQP
jgi:tetratricopeptide (TPR) repeat protein